MSLLGPNGTPLSQRKVRDSVEEQQRALRLTVQAFQGFLRLPFFGRLKWLLFGVKGLPKS